MHLFFTCLERIFLAASGNPRLCHFPRLPPHPLGWVVVHSNAFSCSSFSPDSAAYARRTGCSPFGFHLASSFVFHFITAGHLLLLVRWGPCSKQKQQLARKNAKGHKQQETWTKRNELNKKKWPPKPPTFWGFSLQFSVPLKGRSHFDIQLFVALLAGNNGPQFAALIYGNLKLKLIN